MTLRLELKLLADAALVGLPNVGKSSLIARISHAKPKIADYPFTTLTPNLGVVRAGEHSFVVADVPGLIEGASEGAGLGHAFLRHIERTALILHVVDLSGGWEDRDPVEDIEIIDRELEGHAPELAERPRIVVGNKLDAEGAPESSERVAAHCRSARVSYHAVSALTGEGVDSLVLAVGERVSTLRSAVREEEPGPEVAYVSTAEAQGSFEARALGGGRFRVEGARVERWVVMTDLGNEEAVAHLQRRLARAGVERALVEAGARDGDEIEIGAVAFELETGLFDDEERD
jgi:GTP-binding protein